MENINNTNNEVINTSSPININNIIIRERISSDDNLIWNILSPIIKEGETYSLPQNYTQEETLEYWNKSSHIVYVVELEGREIIGTYFIHSNQLGNGSHICNCGYAVLKEYSNLKIGYKMCLHSLNLAKELGYKGMQYNFVISSNSNAVNLWKKCGFNIVGELPEAFLSPKYGYVDVYVMFQKLT